MGEKKIRTLGEFAARVGAIEAQIIDGAMSHRDAVVIVDKDTKTMYTVEDIKIEQHEEGGRTVWIEVEEY